MSDTPGGPGWWQANDGKWYAPLAQPPGAVPPMPPPGYAQPQPMYHAPKQRRGPGCLGAIGIAAIVVVGLVVVLIIVAVAVGSKSTNSTSTKDTSPPHAIGETAHTGDFDVTVNAAANPYTPANEIEAAPAGQHLVTVDVTIHNTTADDQVVSTVLLFELTDTTGLLMQWTPVPSAGGQIDGPLAPNDTRRGFAAYKVPDGAPGPLRLRVRGGITATGATFTIP